MAFGFRTLLGWFGLGGGTAMSETTGAQLAVPSSPLADGLTAAAPDLALQLAAVWSCVERRANTVASLPLFAYTTKPNGGKELARDSSLYALLHDSPNARMTPFEFWRAMMINHDLRGNAYARIVRDHKGEAIAMWPMPADQVRPIVLDDGTMVYEYRVASNIAVLADENVLHLKGLGNGTIGFSRIDFMRASTDEQIKAQTNATKLFASGGKPTGVLMIDSVLKPDQRTALRANYAGLTSGTEARLMVLEANMKFQQLSLDAEDQQLLETRQFGVEEICRWFDVPPVLAHHSNVTTWGSGIQTILDGWHKLTVRPLLVSIEQAVRKRVMTAGQRASMSCEFNHDAILRGNAKERADLYAQLVQNGIATRAECRQLENLPPMAGTDELTAQTNLSPLAKLGQTQGVSNALAPKPVAQ